MSFSHLTYHTQLFLLFWNVQGRYCVPTKFHCCLWPIAELDQNKVKAPKDHV